MALILKFKTNLRRKQRGAAASENASPGFLTGAHARVAEFAGACVSEGMSVMNEVESSNDIYRLMVEQTLDCALFVVDADGRVRTWNAGAERINGYRGTEIIGQHVSIFYLREDARNGKPEQELLAAGTSGRFEDMGWRLRKDGTRFWAHVVISALRGEAGELLGFVEMTHDMSDQKQAQDELRRSEDRFHLVIEAAPAAMIMADRAGRITMLNLQAECLFGYSRDELLGQPVEMLIPERFRKPHQGHRRSFFAAAKVRQMGHERDVFALAKDGTEFPVLIHLSPIETANGLAVLAAVTDITELKRKEEQLARGQERFRQLIEEAPNAWVLAGEDGRIEMVNWKAERLFGYPRDELQGRPVELLVPERFRKEHPSQRAGFFAHPRPRLMGKGRELFGLKRDGSEFPLEIALSPVETEEGRKVLAAAADITERKRSQEEIQAALKEKEVILGELHHRVKNMLQIVHSMLRVHAARSSDEAARALSDCECRIKAMALVHQTLYQSSDFAKVDFAGFLSALALFLVNTYGVDPRLITITIEAERALLPVSAAIPCGEIVNELLVNAIKHAFPHGRRGHITVAMTVEENGNGEVLLSVTDDGIGLPADINIGGGQTLGLDLVAQLVNQLEGQLTMQRADPTRVSVRFFVDGNWCT